MKPLMLDLFAGTKSSSKAFRENGWKVITVDNNPEFNCTHTADMLKWKYRGRRPTFVWASPPCTEFSRESMPWCKTGKDPDLSLLKATIKLIADIKPVFWAIENVRGAINWFRPLLGDYKYSCGPFFLWGNFPTFEANPSWFKEKFWSDKKKERAAVPYNISVALEREISNSFFFKIPTDRVRT